LFCKVYDSDPNDYLSVKHLSDDRVQDLHDISPYHLCHK
jgi:hypothetical protein